MGARPPTNVSRKRPFTAVSSVPIPKFGVPINPKVPVIQETGSVPVPSVAAGGPPQAATVETQPPVPAAGTFRQEAPQVDREHFAAVQNDILNMISQQDPEETPVEPPPVQNSDLHLDPAIMERINSYGSISIS